MPCNAVLQFLLQRDPESAEALDNTGALPLHRFCGAKPPYDAMEVLFKAVSGSISVQTNSSEMPFVVACKTRASESAMLLLLKAYPDALEDIQWATAHQASRK